MPEVTIRDVANEAGLSVSSVSRILRGGQGHVYPTSTHDRVREIADRLGYRANAAARLLRQTTRTLIGISTHLTEHPHLNRFLVSVRGEVLNRGYDPVIFDSGQLAGVGSGQSFPPPHMLAGLVNLDMDLEQGWPEHYAVLRKTMPIVAMQTVSREAAAWVDVVHVDYASSYRQAIEHLMRLGHSRIAYLGPIDGVTPIDRYKHQGWHLAALESGLDPQYAIPWQVESGQGSVRMDEMMAPAKIQRAVVEAATQWKNLEPRPTAVICASDEVAICLQSYLLAQGFKLPQELSLIGYDGIAMGAFTFPALTTIEPDYECMAQAAISRLLLRISEGAMDGNAPPQEFFIKPHLIVRDSTIVPG